jgi:hypothetical protein
MKSPTTQPPLRGLRQRARSVPLHVTWLLDTKNLRRFLSKYLVPLVRIIARTALLYAIQTLTMRNGPSRPNWSWLGSFHRSMRYRSCVTAEAKQPNFPYQRWRNYRECGKT